MKRLWILTLLALACGAGGEGPELFERSADVPPIDAGLYDDPSVGEWPVDPFAGPGRPLFARHSLLTLDGPASLYEDSSGAFAYDGLDDGQSAAKYTFPEFYGNQRFGNTATANPCQIKHGFINVGNSECVLPSASTSYKWRIKSSATGNSDYVAAIRAAMAFYKNSLNVPLVEISGTDESYYLSFEGFAQIAGNVAATTLTDFSAVNAQVFATGGDTTGRGFVRFRTRNRVVLDPDQPWTPLTFQGIACHEPGHAFGLTHHPVNPALTNTCMYAATNGLQLQNKEKQRLLAVVRGTQNGNLIAPAVPGDDGL